MNVLVLFLSERVVKSDPPNQFAALADGPMTRQCLEYTASSKAAQALKKVPWSTYSSKMVSCRRADEKVVIRVVLHDLLEGENAHYMNRYSMSVLSPLSMNGMPENIIAWSRA